MSIPQYLDGDREQEIREELRFAPLDVVAARAGYLPEVLGRLLGLPTSQPAPTSGDDFDLFACDKLDAQL